MDTGITDLLSFCSRVDFGTVNLSLEEEAFRGELNQAILSLCKDLPKTRQTEAVLFLMNYMQASFSGGLSFVNYFYAPAWSILFWLQHSFYDDEKLEPEYVQEAKTGHTMAMFLHAFDDHLTDGQLPITHLALLIRSQSWTIMNRAFERLARDVEKGPAIVHDFIDDYYASIATTAEMKSLDSYCDLFRKQMATALITPTLLSERLCTDAEFSRSIQAAYCSFGIAWRLLDDLQDIEKDMLKGVHSSIYVCLNAETRACWDESTKKIKGYNNSKLKSIIDYIREKRVIECIMERICRELDSAASIADAYSLPGLASEFRSLLKPLQEGQHFS